MCDCSEFNTRMRVRVKAVIANSIQLHRTHVKDAVCACSHACERRSRLVARMWLVAHHRCLDMASVQAPSNQTKDIDKFIHNGRPSGDRPDGEV